MNTLDVFYLIFFCSFQANINMNAMNATASEIIQHGMNTAALVTTGGPAGPGGALTNGGPLMLTGPPGAVTDVEEVQALTGPGAQPGGQTVLTYTSVYEQAMQPTKINEVAGPPLAQVCSEFKLLLWRNK